MQNLFTHDGQISQLFAIIDVEGAWLKQPPHHNFSGSKSKSQQATTLIVTEVSGVIVKDYKIKGGFSYRLKYDIRNLYQANIKTIKYLNKHFPNTFRNELVVNSNHAITPNKCRQIIHNLEYQHTPHIPLYAKGNRLESIWLNCPTSCDGNFDPLPAHFKRIGEIEQYVPKYDHIPNRPDIINQHISNINPSNVSEQHILHEYDKLYSHHYSLYECIVFAHILLQFKCTCKT